MGLGTLLGALTRTERWEAVPAVGAALQVWPRAGRTTVVVGYWPLLKPNATEPELEYPGDRLLHTRLELMTPQFRAA